MDKRPMMPPASPPALAIVTPNGLTALGLEQILKDSFPRCCVQVFPSYAALAAEGEGDAAPQFFHYFVEAAELMAGASYFLARQRSCIVLTRSDADAAMLPQGFRTLNVCCSPREVMNQLSLMSRMGHKATPAPAMAATVADGTGITPRECEVLRGIVSGKRNKEIAADMGVTDLTVITHRKNITHKLGVRSVSALTVYALMHGIVGVEDVK